MMSSDFALDFAGMLLAWVYPCFQSLVFSILVQRQILGVSYFVCASRRSVSVDPPQAISSNSPLHCCKFAVHFC